MSIYVYTYINIQNDNSLLTKRIEKALKSQRIVCSHMILNQIQKGGKFFTDNVWKLLILP